MPNLARMLRDEIRRLARREARSEHAAVRSQATKYRRDIAQLKRQVSQLLRRVSFLEKVEKKRPLRSAQAAPADESPRIRFSAKWLAAHRARLGLSAADYGRLVGVSSLTIYNWEHGKSRPRARHMSAIAAVRSLRKREALRRLELMQ